VSRETKRLKNEFTPAYVPVFAWYSSVGKKAQLQLLFGIDMVMMAELSQPRYAQVQAGRVDEQCDWMK
jgi:hypothetical protein